MAFPQLDCYVRDGAGSGWAGISCRHGDSRRSAADPRERSSIEGFYDRSWTVEIDVSERDALDRHEGLGFGYRRDDSFVVNASALGTDAEASTYLAIAQDARLIRFDWYLAAVIAGALHHEMSDSHVAGLRSTRFVEDTKTDRKTRIAAIQAMRDHGVDDFRMLLGT